MKAFIVIHKSEYELIKSHMVNMSKNGLKASLFNHDDVTGVRFAENLGIEELSYGTYVKVYVDDEGRYIKHAGYSIGILAPENYTKNYTTGALLNKNTFIVGTDVLCLNRIQN